MAGSLNKVLLIGRLGADPEVKQMVNGKSVARLSLATSQSWKDKNTGEKKEKTEWHRVVVFNEGLVNVVQQYLKKGAQVYVEGQLSTRKWKDEQSGQDKYSTEILIQGYNSSLTMLGGGNQNSISSQDNKQNFDDNSISQNEMDDDNESSAIIELVEKIIEEAIESDASDIHIQPSEFDLDIRYRIDGVLQSIMILPHSRTRPINSRIKVMSNLDIAETRKPQDGRFKHSTASGKAFDFRVSTYPTEFGEKTVMRILDPSKGQISLNKLGFSEGTLNKWHDAIGNSTGIILVTGPTGSGKSTTLYATLSLLNKPGVNILTIEDPVEYNMKGIAQGQVNEKAGMTFSAALSSMLRQDPDIIMVGEMRDVATIELAVRAALTGHLVLSTLHTNDTTSSYSRLLDMGIDPFLITSTVRAIIAQRLIRKICTSCRRERVVNEFEQEKYGFDDGEKVFESNNDGCQNCAGNGFRGRCGIYELLIPTHSINEMINNRVSDQEIRTCLLYTSPSPRDRTRSRMPSSA